MGRETAWKHVKHVGRIGSMEFHNDQVIDYIRTVRRFGSTEEDETLEQVFDHARAIRRLLVEAMESAQANLAVAQITDEEEGEE